MVTLKMQELGFGDGGDAADGLEDRGGDVAIEADEGDGVRAAAGFAATEGEGGDVDAELSEHGTDLADDTRLVAILEIENGAFELGFERDALDLQNAG